MATTRTTSTSQARRAARRSSSSPGAAASNQPAPAAQRSSTRRGRTSTRRRATPPRRLGTRSRTRRGCFPRESYRPGATARSCASGRATRDATVQIFRAGPSAATDRRQADGGRAGHRARAASPCSAAAPAIAIQIGDWPSGLYFAQLTAPGRRRLRAVRPPAQAARRASRRGRPADPHLAGLQLPRRQRRRHGRHLVRARGPPQSASAGRS